MRDAMRVLDRLVTAVAGAAVVLCVACSSPPTDIVATNTESTGDYHLANVRATDSLTADICVSDSGDAEDAAARVSQQLVNKGFRSMTLNVYTRDRNVGRATWTADNGFKFDKGSGQSGSPCR